MIKILQVVLASLLAAAVAAVYWNSLLVVAQFALGHLLFPVLLLIVYGLVFGLLGPSYGLPGLFWHDRLRTRLGAAAAVTLLLILLGVLGYFALTPLDGDSFGPSPEFIDALIARVAPSLVERRAENDAGRLARFLLVASPPFLALLLAPALFPAAFPRVPRSVPEILISRDKVGARMGGTTSTASNPAARTSGTVVVPIRFAADRPVIEARLAQIDPAVDLSEPFARVREAVG